MSFQVLQAFVLSAILGTASAITPIEVPGTKYVELPLGRYQTRSASRLDPVAAAMTVSVGQLAPLPGVSRLRFAFDWQASCNNFQLTFGSICNDLAATCQAPPGGGTNLTFTATSNIQSSTFYFDPWEVMTSGNSSNTFHSCLGCQQNDPSSNYIAMYLMPPSNSTLPPNSPVSCTISFVLNQDLCSSVICDVYNPTDPCCRYPKTPTGLVFPANPNQTSSFRFDMPKFV